MLRLEGKKTPENRGGERILSLAQSVKKTNGARNVSFCNICAVVFVMQAKSEVTVAQTSYEFFN